MTTETPSAPWRSMHGLVWMLGVTCLVSWAVQPADVFGQDVLAAEMGRLTGTAVLGGDVSVGKARFRIYSEFGQGQFPEPEPDGSEFANVVIYLEQEGNVPVSETRRDGRQAMEQVGERFVPHVLPVLKGSRVAFPNGDPIFHNVFSLSRTQSFDLGRYPKGASKSVRFEKPGIAQVFCHIHSDMSAVILVLDTPYFVVPDPDGHFELDNLPAGEYRLVAWHERIRPIERSVRIRAGEIATVQLVIPNPPPSERGSGG